VLKTAIRLRFMMMSRLLQTITQYARIHLPIQNRLSVLQVNLVLSVLMSVQNGNVIKSLLFHICSLHMT